MQSGASSSSPPLRSLSSTKVSPAVTTATTRTIDRGAGAIKGATDTLSASDTLLDVIAGDIAADPVPTTSPQSPPAALPVVSPDYAQRSVPNRRGLTLARSATIAGEGTYAVRPTGSPPSRMHSSGALSPPASSRLTSAVGPSSSSGLGPGGLGATPGAASAATGSAGAAGVAGATGSGGGGGVGNGPASTRPGLGGGLDLKVVILGAQGVGKTSLVHRYTSGQFNASSIPSTIGASFLTKKLIIDGVKVRLQLWDTAGQERFRSMAPMYYRGANAAVIVYDITNPASFDDVRTWIEELRKNVHTDLVIHIVGSKVDLASRYRQVSLDDAQQLVTGWTRALSPSASPPSNPLMRSQSQKSAPTSSFRRTHGGASTSPTSPGRDSLSGDAPPTSRLASGFGSLAAMRRGLIATTTTTTMTPNEDEDGGSGSGKSNNSSTKAADEAAAVDRGVGPEGAWDFIEVTEVSAKDNEGIEDVFVGLATRLVERREQMEAMATRRRQKLAGQHGADRDSIFLGQGTDSVDGFSRARGQGDGSGAAAGSWCCGA